MMPLSDAHFYFAPSSMMSQAPSSDSLTMSLMSGASMFSARSRPLSGTPRAPGTRSAPHVFGQHAGALRLRDAGEAQLVRRRQIVGLLQRCVVEPDFVVIAVPARVGVDGDGLEQLRVGVGDVRVAGCLALIADFGEHVGDHFLGVAVAVFEVLDQPVLGVVERIAVVVPRLLLVFLLRARDLHTF